MKSGDCRQDSENIHESRFKGEEARCNVVAIHLKEQGFCTLLLFYILDCIWTFFVERVFSEKSINN